MPFQERRWGRKEPSIRTVQSDIFEGPTLAPVYTAEGYFGGYYGHGYYIAFHEGDSIDIDTTQLARGSVNSVKSPNFLEQSGTHLVGNMPLVLLEDESDYFDLDLEIGEALVPPPALITRILPLNIETTPVQPKASDFPIQVDLNRHIRGLMQDTEFRIVEVREHTPSLVKTNLSENLEDGVYAYAPQGNYLHNFLEVMIEVFDDLHPTIQASRAPQYAPIMPGFASTSELGQSTIETVLVSVEDDVIGDPDKEGVFWTDQGNNGTCLLAATGSILESLGIGSYDDLLSRTVVRINGNGNVIDDNNNIVPRANWGEYFESIGVDILIDGFPPYVEIVERLSNEYLTAVEFKNPGISRLLTVGSIMPNPALRQKWDWVQTVFDAYDVPSHTGYATNFGTIVKEIQEGNKIVAYVDATELWRSPLIEFIDDNDFIPFSAARSSENHALWITGIDTNTNPPSIILNDSGSESGREARYPLEAFLNAFEDSEFVYTATGADSPDADIQAQRKEIYDIIFDDFHPSGLTNQRFMDVTDRLVSNRFNKNLRDYDFIDKLDAKYPGFRAKVRAYKMAVEEQRTDVLSSIGLSTEEIAEIKEIFEDVDDE